MVRLMLEQGDPFGALQLCKDVQDIRAFQKRVTWFGFGSRKARENRIVSDSG